MPRPTKRTSKSVGIKLGFRSGLEEVVAAQLEREGVPVEYEKHRILYQVPSRPARYTPDFKTGDFFVETKGRFLTADRQKHLLIKAQHPDYDIRFVFSNSRARISKQSSTTYADWCEKHGFKYADKVVPAAWIKEAKGC